MYFPAKWKKYESNAKYFHRKLFGVYAADVRKKNFISIVVVGQILSEYTYCSMKNPLKSRRRLNISIRIHLTANI